MDGGAWWAAVHGVAKSRARLGDFTFTFHFHALEKDMATHSSVLAWRIPGTSEPGGLLSMGSHRVGHDWSDLAAAAGPLYVLLYIVLIRISCVDMEPQVIQFHGCRIFHCVNNYKVTVYLSLTILGGLELCGFFITGMDIMNIKCAWLTFRECRFIR